MNDTRISLQSILLGLYLILIISMIGGTIYSCVFPQKNEILPASICLVIFVICFISGLINVFYFQKISKKMYWTFMFYLLLPLSIPLLILELKCKDKINNEIFVHKTSFTKKFIVITTILQIMELIMIGTWMQLFLLTSSEDIRKWGWYFFIPFSIALFGLIFSWLYFLTNNKIFKALTIINIQFGIPYFFLNYIISNENKKNELKKLQ